MAATRSDSKKIDANQKSTWQLCWKNEEWEDANIVPVEPLLKASRDIRIDALKNIGHLISGLQSEARSRIEAIQFAKELVKEL